MKNYFLAADCETTGFSGKADPSIDHQAVAWGLIVADANTFEAIDKLYVEIKWNAESKRLHKEHIYFGKGAEKIHGLSFEHLERYGLDERDAVEEMGSFIFKYFEREPIRLLGHNIASFDIFFLRKIFATYNIYPNFHYKHIDTNSVGYVTIGARNSQELFEMLGMTRSGKHNALKDAEMALESVRRIRKIFDSFL